MAHELSLDVLPVDPALAAEILARPTRNRPLSRATVARYAGAMTRGEWRVTPHGILLGPDGALIDGQHRLQAVVESGCTVEMAVFFDVDPSLFAVLDTGYRRRASNVLALQGEANPILLAAALRYLHLYLTIPDLVWSGPVVSVTNGQLLEVLESHPTIREATATGARLAAACGMIPSAAVVAVCVTEKWGGLQRDNLAEWYTGLYSGANLESGSPCLALREAYRRMRDRTSTRRRQDTRAHLALYLRAWIAWRDGERLTRVTLPAKMPVLTPAIDVAA